jgi:antitoxin ParD1/3/4
MAKVAKISIALTAGMAELVHQAVESGDYASGSEVIREALREWKLRRQLREQERDEARRLWREGMAGGPERLRDLKAIKRALKREAKRRSAVAPGEGV